MLKTIILKELLVQTLDSKFAICYTAVFVLVLTSMVNLGVQYKRDHHDAMVQQEQFEKEVSGMKLLNEAHLCHVIVPPNQLRIFSLGFDKEMSQAFQVQYSSDPGQVNNADPLYQQYKVYDLGFIVAVIISLMAIFLNYGLFNGEIADRTMHLVLANSVPRGAVILGKMIGGYTVLMAPLVCAWLLGLAIVTFLLGIPFTPGDWVRMLLMLTAVGCYLALVFLMTALFSILFKNPVLSLVTSLVTWVVMVFVVPNGSLLIGKLVRPIPNEAQMMAQVSKRVQPERNRGYREDAQANELQSYLFWSEVNMRASKIASKTIDEQRAALRRQLIFCMDLSRLSPTNNFLYCFTHLAGTGFLDLVRFDEWKTQFMKTNSGLVDQEYLRRLKSIYSAAGPSTTMSSTDAMQQLRAMGPLDAKTMPNRKFGRYGLAQSLSLVSRDFLFLVLGSILLYAACFLAFVRTKL
jgi:ABC-type transport system involved in multi-copper enzyme maturation permease subunit